MRPSKKFVNAVIREFCRLFPAAKDVKFEVEFKRKLKLDKKELRASFNTELPDWSPTFQIGYIDLSEDANQNLDEYGVSLVHELTHCYFKKVGRIHKLVEELLCECGDTKLYELIKNRLKKRHNFWHDVPPMLAKAA